MSFADIYDTRYSTTYSSGPSLSSSSDGYSHSPASSVKLWSTGSRVFAPSQQDDDQTHIALQRFAEFANEDVEMQVPLSERAAFLVVDTNILLHYLDVLVQFVHDVERLDFPVIIIIPSAVVDELDGQKKGNSRISWFSRKASSWLLKKVQERKTVKGQARGEVYSIKQTDYKATNDEKIIDCAMYFARLRRTFMHSADNNLSFKCSSEDIDLINPMIFAEWSSQKLASLIFGESIPGFEKFSKTYKTYKEGSNVIEDEEWSDDKMDVDESFDDNISQKAASDSLHIQVIEHFTALLTDLVASDQRERAAEGASVSRHAPKYLKKKASEMTPSELLIYLDNAPSGRLNLRQSNPALDAFLTRPYVPQTGARLGQHWSKEDWLVCLRKLEKIGRAWNGKGQGQAIIDSLKVDLEPHLEIVFAQRMTI